MRYIIYSADCINIIVLVFPALLAKALRKHAFSNILRIFPPKYENFQMTNSDIFLISAQNIHCGYSLEPPRQGGFNEFPLSMF